MRINRLWRPGGGSSGVSGQPQPAASSSDSRGGGSAAGGGVDGIPVASFALDDVGSQYYSDSDRSSCSSRLHGHQSHGIRRGASGMMATESLGSSFASLRDFAVGNSSSSGRVWPAPPEAGSPESIRRPLVSDPTATSPLQGSPS